MMDIDLSFKHPTTIQLSGPTGCGKTRLVRRILEERLIQPFPSRIIWVYGEWQDDYKAIQDQLYVEFVHGYSDTLLDSLDATERNLLILDDQMGEASDSKSLAQAFYKRLASP